MNVFFFGSSKEQLFGAYHPPRGNHYRNDGIVLCYPIGFEYIRSHWAFRQLTERLVQIGFHVMRFDYFGVGDSSGECGAGNMDRWTSDILSATEELRDISKVRKISLIGFRLGAALAALASRKMEIDYLVLWDPVIQGKQYLHELQILHNKLLANPNKTPPDSEFLKHDSNELLGFPFPPSLRQSINETDLLNLKEWKDERIYINVSEEADRYNQLYESINATGAKVEKKVAFEKDGADTLERLEDALLRESSIQSITEIMSEKGK